MPNRNGSLLSSAVDFNSDSGAGIGVIADLKADLDAIRTELVNIGLDLTAVEGASALNLTGWADYVDTTYTSGSPLAIVADTDTVLPNNAGTIIQSEKPTDISAFYSGGVITGREGDGIAITVDFDVTPTEVGTTFLETWVDIGGSVGELYRRIATFPKGNGVERHITFSTVGYTLDTWEANGGTVYVRTNGTANIYNIRFLLHRTHRAVS